MSSGAPHQTSLWGWRAEGASGRSMALSEAEDWLGREAPRPSEDSEGGLYRRQAMAKNRKPSTCEDRKSSLPARPRVPGTPCSGENTHLSGIPLARHQHSHRGNENHMWVKTGPRWGGGLVPAAQRPPQKSRPSPDPQNLQLEIGVCRCHSVKDLGMKSPWTLGGPACGAGCPGRSEQRALLQSSQGGGHVPRRQRRRGREGARTQTTARLGSGLGLTLRRGAPAGSLAASRRSGHECWPLRSRVYLTV